jgi:FAD/FMN-containing dehydrogenase
MPRQMTEPSWNTLDRALAGAVVLPSSPDYRAAATPEIPRFDPVWPAAVVRCRTPGDVAETLAFARRSGLPTAVRSGGHCFAWRSSTSGIVIDVSPMASVSLSGEVATIGAGARLGAVYDALAAQGRTIAAGCGPTVGIAGLALGGGLGILGRRHGLTCDQLLGARVVLADGRVVDCDQRHHEDLFWALRGAGAGAFGVVTSLVFRTLPAPQATCFRLTWPASQAASLVETWQRWSPDAPDELAASLLVVVPSEIDAPPVVNVFGSMLGDQADLAPLLEDLVARVGAEPDSATQVHLPLREAKRWLAEHGPGDEQPEGHPFSKSEYFRRPLPSEAGTSLVEHLVADRVAGESRELDFSPWGGAYNRVEPDETAFVHRRERFLLKHGVVVGPATLRAGRLAARRWLAGSWATVHPYGTGGVYPNFPDPDLEDPLRAYHGANLDRLRRVKRAYDPEGFFSSGQSPAG